MTPKFKVIFTEEVSKFVDSLPEKTRNKVYFNIDKASFGLDPEIFKKLVRNEKGSAKGVTQLVNTIDAIKKKQFKQFDDYHFENIVIYPIIVYVDFSFTLAGVNHILNNEFKQQLEEKDTNYHKHIKDLILIDLDSFIKFQDLFRNKTLKVVKDP